jgi:meso-butanediol dehydrogenase / (S,S)-butanediol dehydrogenase / diacetyl reductase
MNFLGKVAVVTGAASGIGAATAKQLTEQGARVVVVDRNEKEGQRVATELNESRVSGSASFQKVNVADWNSVQEGFARIGDQFGRIDILVNNAGVGSFGLTPDLPVDQWQNTIAITLNGAFYCSKAAIPLLRAARGGAIVNVGSTSGLGGDYGLAAYNAAKGGVVNFTRTLAIDHIRENIRVNCVCPGLVDTPAAAELKAMKEYWARVVDAHPRGRASTADEIASVILFLASDKSAALVGAAVVADGGLTAWNGMPGLSTP